FRQRRLAYLAFYAVMVSLTVRLICFAAHLYRGQDNGSHHWDIAIFVYSKHFQIHDATFYLASSLIPLFCVAAHVILFFVPDPLVWRHLHDLVVRNTDSLVLCGRLAISNRIVTCPKSTNRMTRICFRVK